jgi:hypothetical protein
MGPTFLTIFDTMKIGELGNSVVFPWPSFKAGVLRLQFLNIMERRYFYLCCTVRSGNFTNMEKSCLLCHMSGFVFRFAVFFFSSF